MGHTAAMRAPRALVLALIVTFTASPAAGDSWDSTRPLRRAAFGSCAHQERYPRDPTARTIWDAVLAYAPEAWFWLGDAVYVRSHSPVAVLEEAYAKQRAHPGYAAVVEAVGGAVDGTWDDHDLGVNDGGKDVGFLRERQAAYLKFIDKDGVPERAERGGVYSAHRLCDGAGCARSVGVVFLDTRTHRDPPAWGYNVGGAPLPFFGLVGSIARLASAALGIYAEGDVLGDAQWAWLERLVRENQPHPPAAALDDHGDAPHAHNDNIDDPHNSVDAWIIVSSIQVNTSIPLFESWGHFPNARRRLLSLFNGSNSVTFVSGDVHFAEHGEHEITTSGITHSCQTQFRLPICTPVLQYFTAHRPDPAGYYGGLNFMGLDVDFAAGHLSFTVRDIENAVVLARRVPLRTPTRFYPDAAAFATGELALVFIALPLVVAAVLALWLWRWVRARGCKRKVE